MDIIKNKKPLEDGTNELKKLWLETKENRVVRHFCEGLF